MHHLVVLKLFRNSAKTDFGLSVFDRKAAKFVVLA